MPTFVFGPFCLDPVARRLTRDGEPVPLTAKVFDTLELLVYARGETVTREAFVARLWPDTVVEERNLTVNISTLRKALARHGEADCIATVPRRGYRLTMAVMIVDGGPGVREQVARSEPGLTSGAPALESGGEHLSARWPALRARAAFVLGALVVAVSLGAMVSRTGESAVPAASDTVTVAVLPFVVAGQGPDVTGVGIAAATIARLSEVSGLEVEPLDAVAAIAERDDLAAVGRRLGVARVVSGVVVREPGRAAVVSRMVDVGSGSVRWEERFEQPAAAANLSEAFAADLAASLVRQIYIDRTWARASDQPAGAEALRAYREAMDRMNRHEDGDFAAAVAAFQRTVALEPGYAPAWAGLARAYRMQGFAPGGRPAAVMASARAAAERAVAADERLAEAHTALGIMHYTYDWDWAAAERAFRRAVAADPQAQDALGWLGGFLIDMGRFDEGLAILRQARARNPLAPAYNQTLAVALWRAGRVDEALGMLDEAARIRVVSAEPFWLRAHVLDSVGRTEEAIAARAAAAQAARDAEYARAFESAARRGYRAVVEQELAMRLARHELPEAAALMVALGRHADAVAALEACADEFCHGVAAIANSPSYAPLYPQPRFQALLSRVHLRPRPGATAGNRADDAREVAGPDAARTADGPAAPDGVQP